ncbi:VOC family protein [Roseibium sp. CAU 1637]|uniref:VOC family protein n=1 Tax=Roseibium limicola TaxID=2816037 RepID=A0A939JBB5_9HYPH|nr:VOC family protein [Roseibium limicola]MBO0347288.1 VOC family protein [Roseibium limicola]
MTRGLDHIVVAVKDLEAAGKAWQALGFTVTPTNHHAWGTANKLVQLDGFFVELLSVAEPDKIVEATETAFSFGAFNRDFLKTGEGISMLVADSLGAEQDRADYQRLGLKTYEPFGFEREANLPDGATAKVAFDLTFATDPHGPELGFFACHNKYPENFWKPAFQSHANGATAVSALYMVAGDPSDHHEFLGGFIGQREMRATSLGLELPTARGEINVLTRQAYAYALGEAAAESLPDTLPCFAALEVACKGLEARKVIPARELHGMSLVLSPA